MSGLSPASDSFQLVQSQIQYFLFVPLSRLRIVTKYNQLPRTKGGWSTRAAQSSVVWKWVFAGKCRSGSQPIHKTDAANLAQPAILRKTIIWLSRRPSQAFCGSQSVIISHSNNASLTAPPLQPMLYWSSCMCFSNCGGTLCYHNGNTHWSLGQGTGQ